MIDANRAYLARWTAWAGGQTPEDTAAFLGRVRRQRESDDGFQSAILSDGEIAGVIGYLGVDRVHRSTTLGYWLAEPHQGRGMVTGAVRELTGHAFSAWDLGRVEIRVASENRRSRAIPERLGFREEAVMRSAERVGEERHDMVVYSMLAAEWDGGELSSGS